MRYSTNCEVCPIVQAPGSEAERFDIIAGDYWIANLRQDDQSLLGTAYVTLRDHKESQTELTSEEDTEFVIIRNKLLRAQMQAFGAAIVNTSCLMNNAFQDVPAAPHVHHHFKPRYKEPVIFAEQTFYDDQFGHYLTQKNRRPVSDEVAEQITGALRSLM